LLQRFDDLDMKLLFELSKDGNISVPTLSKKLGVSASVLYSRIKRLVRKKLIKKFTIEIDNLNQLKKIMGFKFDRLLFDNMNTKNLRKGVRLSKNQYD